MHWDDPEGWYREGGGRRVQDGEPGRPLLCVGWVDGWVDGWVTELKSTVGPYLQEGPASEI